MSPPDDDFPDSVIRAGLQAQADALAPKAEQIIAEMRSAVSQQFRKPVADCVLILDWSNKVETAFRLAVAQARAEQREQDAQLVDEYFKTAQMFATACLDHMRVERRVYTAEATLLHQLAAAIRRSGEGTTP